MSMFLAACIQCCTCLNCTNVFFRDPCLQKVKRYYKKERAKKGAYLPVEFEEEKISLDIPMPDGVTVSEWKLTPLVPPNVRLTTSSFTKCIQ